MIDSAISVLHQAFNNLNRDLFHNELPLPAILIQKQGKGKSTLGWCSSGEIWSNSDGSNKLYELTICAEWLDIGLLETVAVELHEMIHLYCNINQIKDTSRGVTYHNKKYKSAAEEHGLNCEHDNKCGWSVTSLKEETKQLILNYKLDETPFNIARMVFEGNGKGNGGSKKSTMKKYKCDCEIVIRCQKEINVTCEDCGERFEEV